VQGGSIKTPCGKRVELWFQRFKVEYHEPLSNFPFNGNLRRYTAVQAEKEAEALKLELSGKEDALNDAMARGGIENKHYTNVESTNRVRVTA